MTDTPVIIYAGSPREQKAYAEIKLIFLQHIESVAEETGDWLEADEADRDRALVLYRCWHNHGWQTVDDEGDVIEFFKSARLEYLQERATKNAEEDAEFRALRLEDKE